MKELKELQLMADKSESEKQAEDFEDSQRCNGITILCNR